MGRPRGSNPEPTDYKSAHARSVMVQMLPISRVSYGEFRGLVLAPLILSRAKAFVRNT